MQIMKVLEGKEMSENQSEPCTLLCVKDLPSILSKFSLGSDGYPSTT